MKNVLTFLFVFYSLIVFSKDDPAIQGKILDIRHQPVSYATVLLQNSADTSLIKADISDENGEFRFLQIPAGSYFISVTYVGYADLQSEIFEYNGNSLLKLPELTLMEKAEQLAQVTVKSSRPIVEVQPDKTVFNIDGSVNAVGNTALELLRKSPGVMVDNNENLLLQGKNGVQIYIDGKKSPLNGQDLANYLKTLQSTEIDAIEIITNPSARYDAEGNAGIINIRLKKNQNYGLNGNLNLGFRYGQAAKYSGSTSLNYRNKYLNTFGTYSIFAGEFLNDFFLYREQGGNSYDQINGVNNLNNNHNFRWGADFFLNEKNTIGVLVNGSISDEDSRLSSNTDIANLAATSIDSFLLASNRIDQSRDNLTVNVNYVYQGSKNNRFNVDFDYGLYRNNSVSFQPNQYLGPDRKTILSERTFSNVTPTNIDIYTGKMDYEAQLWGGQFSTGAKIARVRTENTFDIYDIIEGERVKNLDRSNNFVYRENVNAAYVNWTKQISKTLNFSGGLRMEHTHSMGDLTSFSGGEQEVVERDYLNFFPSAGLSWQANEKNMWRVSYSRRIDRPNYQDLNPFEFQLDELTFQRGNPFLNPQYSNSYSLTHSYKQMLNTTLSHTVIHDVFTQITDAVDDRKATLTNINLTTQKNTAISVSYPFQLAKWWNVYSTATGYFLQNEANIDGKIIDLDAWAFNLFAQNTFMLPKGFKAELSGWYNAPTLWGNWVTNSQYDVSVGISKGFWNNTGTFKLTYSDIFFTNGWGGESRFGNLYMRGGGTWESRQVRMNFTYLLGNKQVKAARNRQTGMEEEKNRIGSGN